MNRKCLQVRVAVIFAVTLLVGPAQIPVYAQGDARETQETDRHGSRQIRFLQIENEQNTAILHTEYEREKQQLSSSDSPIRRSRLLFQEGLEMNFRGAVYHPKFMDFDLSLEIAPEQDKEHSDDQAGGKGFRNSYLSRYHLNSRFLREKPLNFSLFTEKQREIINKDFFERQIVDHSSYGGRVNWRNDKMPANFYYNYTQRNIDRSFRADQTQDDETLNLQLRPQFIKWGDTDFDYTHERFKRVEVGTHEEDGTSDRMNLTNHYKWGEGDRKDLASYLRYFSLENSRSSRNLTLDEHLSIEHTDSLSSFYRYNFFDDSVEGVDSTKQDLSAGIKHQLYESLNSAFTVKGTLLETTNFDEKGIDFTLNENYKKHIGLAQLGIGIDYAYEIRKRDAQGTVLNIVNESHALDDAAVVFLNQLDIDTTTVVVTNSAGTKTYIKDLDYQIIDHLSGFTEIKRIVTGDINDGDSVLVDYLVRHNNSSRFSTMRNNYHVSLGFWDNNLRFYSRYRQQRHTNLKGESSLILEKFDDKVVGCQLNLGGANFDVEYEDYASDLTPYTALHLYENFRWNMTEQSFFSLRSSQDYMRLPDDKRENYDFRGKYSLRLTRSSVGSLESGYRLQKGRNTDLENLTSRMTYQLNIGQLHFESGYEFEKQYSVGDKRDNHYVFTTLKRRF